MSFTGKVKVVKQKVKHILGDILREIPTFRNYMHGRFLYKYYKNEFRITQEEFMSEHKNKLYVQMGSDNKVLQIKNLIRKIEISASHSTVFFYSIDCFKAIKSKHRVFDNYTVDYNLIVNGSLLDIKNHLSVGDSKFYSGRKELIDTLYEYYQRCRNDESISNNYSSQLDAIESLFTRSANTFFEALQRILFVNQFVWQTGHKLNGLGHLDWMLIDLYRKDMSCGRVTKESAVDLIEEFYKVLHDNYWFKSSSLLGDTGQIIILGGLNSDGAYEYNELTYLFIQAAMDLKLPDPKVLLRCSTKMPDDLLELSLQSIATGIGQPLLSNDDVVVPGLVSFGYDPKDAYRYVTSACWEPLIPGISCDQNNVASVNYATPFVEMLAAENVSEFSSLRDVLDKYCSYLQQYLSELLNYFSEFIFEEDPLLSMFSTSSIESGKDIVRGGARYSNIGLTSVGIGSVVNSLINIQRLVFEEGQYSFKELNDIRKKNFANKEDLVLMLKNSTVFYGCDDPEVVNLTKMIMKCTSDEFEKHRTKYGGKFKFGLSSPSYITEAIHTGATFDGRRNGEPFSVHISSSQPLPATELLSFAMQLDYCEYAINGNVVDFMVTPAFINENLDKFVRLIKVAFKGGIYQCQMNVVDSATLIAAKNNPDLFPNLIVRVWGFSAYFNDLPDEYKDVLIQRALESEKAA